MMFTYTLIVITHEYDNKVSVVAHAHIADVVIAAQSVVVYGA